MKPERLLRFYPRAWRERYGEEFLALLEDTPLTWAVQADVVGGAVREWSRFLVVPDERRSPYPALTIRAFGRAAGALALSMLISSVTWPIATWLDARALGTIGTGAPIVLGMLVAARGFIGYYGVFAGGPRFVIGRRELWFWLAFAAVCQTLGQVDDLATRRLPWNADSAFPYTQLDYTIRLFTNLQFVVMGTSAALADHTRAKAWRMRRPLVPSNILGLRD
jgi:hypothetical protein